MSVLDHIFVGHFLRISIMLVRTRHGIEVLLQICRLHIHDLNALSYYIPKELYLIC